MTKPIFIAVILALFSFSPYPTSAAQSSIFTFETIYSECLKRSQLCLGYVTGVGEIMAMNRDAKWNLCAAGSVPSSAAMVQAVINFGQGHPEYWQAPSPAVVAVALKNTWPCE